MNINTIHLKILGRVNHHGREFFENFKEYLALKMCRVVAKKLRKHYVSARGHSIISKKLLKEIKKYSKLKFGSEKYWPWLALYTEIRGEFKEGWIPADYYQFTMLNDLNIDAYSRLSTMKSFDYVLFRQNVIKPFAICIKNRVHGIDGRVIEVERLLNEMKRADCEFVIKLDEGSGGKSVQFIHSSEIKKEQIPTDSSAVIQEVIKQHQLLNTINPRSINTFRVLTHLDCEGKVNIKFIFLRFGVANARVDNLSSGGGWVYIHKNGNADNFSFDLQGVKLSRFHPVTGVEFSKITFPFYEEIVKLCIESHQVMPYVGLIGWDVFINESGIPKLLEWNARNPYFWPVEARYGPFFEDLLI